MNFRIFYRYVFVFLLSVFVFTGCGSDNGGGEFTPPVQSEQNKVLTSKVSGNTATYNGIATFYVSLDKKPSADVVIPLSSSDTGEGVIDVNELRFTPNNWNRQQRVVVKGRNSNVVDGKQNYKIILGSIQSSDKSYDGVNPDDVEMRGIYLKLNKITDSTKFISGLESTIDISADYTGNNKLVYSLDKKPDGMIVNEDSGQITWNASDSMEGNNYDVKVKVTDGNLVSELNINISVASLTPIKSKLSGDTVTITESGNLNGLIVTKVDYDTNIRDIEFKKISKESVRDIPSFVTKITDTFVIRNQIKGKIKIKLPLSSLPSGSNLYHLFLYRLTTNSDFSHSFWSPTLIDREISETNGKPVIEIILTGLKGVYFIGIEKDEIETHNTSLEKSTQIFSKDVNIDGIKCNSINIVNMPKDKMEREAYNEQNCTFTSKYTDKIFNVRVIGFGDSENSERWSIKIERLVGWLRDAQDGFRSLHLSYDDSITVFIHKLDIIRDNEKNVGLEGGDGNEDNFTLGYVSSDENRKTIHITQKDNNTNLMKAVSIHEYFHHAQSRSRSDNKDLLIEGEGSEGTWMIEGTAAWFMDYQHDSDNIYRDAIKGIRILENGLLSKDNDYPNSYFFKLINSKCNGKLKFTEIIQKLFSIDKEQDLTGVKNLKKQLAEAECDFGNHLGESKKSSLESALLYYQYATLYKNKISLLDSNEDDDEFEFEKTPYKYIQADYFEVDSVKEENKKIKIKDIKIIPPYGAYSIEVKGDDLVNDLDEGYEQVFRVVTKKNSKPLTIAIISDDNGFKGNSKIDGEELFYYKTDEKIDHIFKEDELTDYFITILNPNDSKVEITDLIFEVRKKASTLTVSTPKNNSKIDTKNITIKGTTEKSTTIDHIAVYRENHLVDTYKLQANNKFEFDVPLKIGINKLILKGFNWEEYTNNNQIIKPLSKDFSLNIERNLTKPQNLSIDNYKSTTDYDIYTLSWDSVDGAEEYAVKWFSYEEVRDTLDNGIGILPNIKTTTSTIKIPKTKKREKYIFSILAKAKGTDSVSSETLIITKQHLSFTVDNEIVNYGDSITFDIPNSQDYVKYEWRDGTTLLPSSSSSFSTSTLTVGTHNIILTATDKYGNQETFEMEVTIKDKLLAPAYLKLTSTDKEITLRWGKVKDASVYKICMSESTITDGSKCTENGGKIIGVTSTIKTISEGLKKDTTYYFRVRGVKGGYESAWSYERSIKLKEASLIKPGTVKGSVIDAVTNKVLSAKITVSTNEGKEVKTLVTNTDGEYTLSLSEGNYIFSVKATGYISELMTVSVRYKETTIISSLRQIPNNAKGDGIAKGKIIDALSGENIDSVTLKVRKGVNNKNGIVVTTEHSDGDGEFSFDLPAGNYTVEATVDGYISIYFELLVIGKETTAKQNASMTPNIQSGEVRVILSWGTKPGDLDSHINTPPMEGSTNGYHVYWEARGSQYSAPYTKLDVDRTDLSTNSGSSSKNGPETITIYESKSGSYHYYVHNFSAINRNSTQGSLISSRAKVDVYGSTGLVKSYNVPNSGSGTYWDVFTYDGGTGKITSINTISDIKPK